jgi:uncharacterized protein YqhQ
LKKCHKTSIGGSALIEGVMMRGPLVAAMAVRKPDGEIDLSSWEVGGLNRWYQKTPFVRGVFNFIDSIRLSYRCLLKSADIAAVSEEPPSGLEKKLQDKFGDKFSDIYGVFAIVLGVMIALGLFMVLPTVLIGLLRPVIASGIWLSVIEAVLKIGAFVLYLYLVSRMQELKECLPITARSIKLSPATRPGRSYAAKRAKMSRFHPRCGTSFLIIVMIVSCSCFHCDMEQPAHARRYQAFVPAYCHGNRV